MKYQKRSGISLFEHENTMESLSNMGNPLVVLKDIIDFEQFRSMLESLFANGHKKSKAGRKPIDPVFMLKVLFLQRPSIYWGGSFEIKFTNTVYIKP